MVRIGPERAFALFSAMGALMMATAPLWRGLNGWGPAFVSAAAGVVYGYVAVDLWRMGNRP